MSHVFPVILSGGSGTRLWPLSRRATPKQFLPLIGTRSLLQETALRLERANLFEALIIIGGDAHYAETETQLRAIGASVAAHVLEPLGRNTAPAAAIAALAVGRQSAGGILALLPADHYIADAPGFRRAVEQGAQEAQAGRIVTFGIVPTAPETGYGYIQRTAKAHPTGAYPVSKFVEKPDRATASAYLASGDYLWNSGMFLARADILLDEMTKHCPQIVAACRKAFENGSQEGAVLRLNRAAFEACPSDSIDYAVMEKTNRASVLPTQFGWSDVGSWSTLWELGEKNEAGNTLMGTVYAHATRNSYIRAQSRLVASVGVEDLVIVETPDSVLVARRDQVQDIKAIIDRLAKDGRAER